MVSGKTCLVGVMGDPVEHSLSPIMHNAAFSRLDMDWIYLPLHVSPAYLPQALNGLRALNFSGANVTVPHKEKVVWLVDELTPQAQLVGAVNTLYWEGENLVGHNTDGAGLVRSLREDAGFEPRGANAAILGAGGSARATAVELAREGICRLDLLVRRREQGEELARVITMANTGTAVAVHPLDGELPASILDHADLLLNTTPVGMPPLTDCSPLPDAGLLRPHLLVYDLIYNPPETILLSQARKAGCRAVNGLGMLLYQGVLAFQCWTGQEAPVEVMRQALQEGLERG